MKCSTEKLENMLSLLRRLSNAGVPLKFGRPIEVTDKFLLVPDKIVDREEIAFPKYIFYSIDIGDADYAVFTGNLVIIVIKSEKMVVAYDGERYFIKYITKQQDCKGYCKFYRRLARALFKLSVRREMPLIYSDIELDFFFGTILVAANNFSIEFRRLPSKSMGAVKVEMVAKDDNDTTITGVCLVGNSTTLCSIDDTENISEDSDLGKVLETILEEFSDG